MKKTPPPPVSNKKGHRVPPPKMPSSLISTIKINQASQLNQDTIVSQKIQQKQKRQQPHKNDENELMTPISKLADQQIQRQQMNHVNNFQRENMKKQQQNQDVNHQGIYQSMVVTPQSNVTPKKSINKINLSKQPTSKVIQNSNNLIKMQRHSQQQYSNQQKSAYQTKVIHQSSSYQTQQSVSKVHNNLPPSINKQKAKNNIPPKPKSKIPSLSVKEDIYQPQQAWQSNSRQKFAANSDNISTAKNQQKAKVQLNQKNRFHKIVQMTSQNKGQINQSKQQIFPSNVTNKQSSYSNLQQKLKRLSQARSKLSESQSQVQQSDDQIEQDQEQIQNQAQIQRQVRFQPSIKKQLHNFNEQIKSEQQNIQTPIIEYQNQFKQQTQWKDKHNKGQNHYENTIYDSNLAVEQNQENYLPDQFIQGQNTKIRNQQIACQETTIINKVPHIRHSSSLTNINLAQINLKLQNNPKTIEQDLNSQDLMVLNTELKSDQAKNNQNQKSDWSEKGSFQEKIQQQKQIKQTNQKQLKERQKILSTNINLNFSISQQNSIFHLLKEFKEKKSKYIEQIQSLRRVSQTFKKQEQQKQTKIQQLMNQLCHKNTLIIKGIECKQETSVIQIESN